MEHTTQQPHISMPLFRPTKANRGKSRKKTLLSKSKSWFRSKQRKFEEHQTYELSLTQFWWLGYTDIVSTKVVLASNSFAAMTASGLSINLCRLQMNLFSSAPSSLCSWSPIGKGFPQDLRPCLVLSHRQIGDILLGMKIYMQTYQLFYVIMKSLRPQRKQAPYLFFSSKFQNKVNQIISLRKID